MLKDAREEVLRFTTHTTNHEENVQRTVRSFSSLRTENLRQFNAFVDEIKMQSKCFKVGLWMRNTEELPMLNGLLTDDGLGGMLEAADVKKLDMISSFIRAFIDPICAESDISTITAVFTNIWKS